MDEPHKVAIVVDKIFCKNKLLALASKMHVWLLESENNLENSKLFYSMHKSASDDPLADGITLFQSVDGELSPLDILVSVIDEVDEHHNEYSHTPGWRELHVYGTALDNNIKEMLKELGFSKFIELDFYKFIVIK